MTLAQRISARPHELHHAHLSPNRGRDRMHRLLVVESDHTARAALTRELRARDFEVLAVDGSAALRGITGQLAGQPDAVALALNGAAHQAYGGRLRVRGEHIDAPVMYLIPRHHMAGELSGFRTGIDDYLVRPFAYGELAVRLRLLIRGRAQAARVHDGLWLDPVNRAVAYRFENVHLSPTEYRLMARLLVRPHTVVGREQLRAAAWPDNPTVSDNLLDQCVSKLRRKLREIDAPHVIRAVRGVGYEFAPSPRRAAP
jgi:two-component system, OmpR family, response regulator